MLNHDDGATVRLAATIARGRYDVDGGTMIADVHPETIVEMALAAKREVDRLRTELAEARSERDAAIAALPSEADLRTLRDALPLRGMSDYVRQDALRIVSRMEDAIRAHAARATKGGE